MTDDATLFELAACAMQAQHGDYRRWDENRLFFVFFTSRAYAKRTLSWFLRLLSRVYQSVCLCIHIYHGFQIMSLHYYTSHEWIELLEVCRPTRQRYVKLAYFCVA